MALDGALLSQIKLELDTQLEGGRIDRIHQPGRDELLFQFRSPKGGGKLYFSASANHPRLHFTQQPPENPGTPPMFCMLLRKHLQGARFIGSTQLGLDRVLFLEFQGFTELGDPTTFTFVVEIMGRHSNLILLDENQRIIDGIHRVDFDTSSVRQILPGMLYETPPRQEKLNLLETPISEVITQVMKQGERPLEQGLLEVLEGFSPLPLRELAFRVAPEELFVSSLTRENLDRLEAQLDATKKLLLSGLTTPIMLMEQNGRPKDFTFLPIQQYGTLYTQQKFDSYSELLDDFYTLRSTIDRMRQKNSHLIRTVSNLSKRIARRLAAQQRELKETEKRETLRIYGDLLTANIHQLHRGMEEAVLENFYEENQKISIPLDPRKTPPQNAQYYYSQYRKADTAEKKLTQLIEKGLQEQTYIDSILESLQRAESVSDLESIQQELQDAGYLRIQKTKKQAKKEAFAPHTFISSDGFTILAGRNNRQNDQLTLQKSSKEDLWFHTQHIPGSHVVIVAQGKEVPETTIREAGAIAAYYSGGRQGSKVPVDYTQIKHVKKLSGGKPGMVIYDHYQTLFSDPSEQLIKNLKQN